MAIVVGKLLLILILALVSFNTIEAYKPKITYVKFYMHDTFGGPNPTSILVARSLANATALEQPQTLGEMFKFGSILSIDNPITSGPERNSTLLGRAQGTGAMTSLSEVSFLMTMVYKFTSGPFNGSSFSVVGRNPIAMPVREMPVVGGSGIFRLARGYAFVKQHSFGNIAAILEYDVTLIHDQHKDV